MEHEQRINTSTDELATMLAEYLLSPSAKAGDKTTAAAIFGELISREHDVANILEIVAEAVNELNSF